MKILVLSDSHGRTDRILDACKLHKNTLDLVIFLGDGVNDMKYCQSKLAGVPVISVSGNHEDATSIFLSEEKAPSELSLTLDGYKLLLMHGHKFGVKGGITRALSYAYAKGADILLFGHTHTPHEKYYPDGTELTFGASERGMYAFNPGSIGAGSAGLLELRENGVVMSHFSPI